MNNTGGGKGVVRKSDHRVGAQRKKRNGKQNSDKFVERDKRIPHGSRLGVKKKEGGKVRGVGEVMLVLIGVKVGKGWIARSIGERSRRGGY